MYRKNKTIEMITLRNFLNKKQDKYTMTDFSFLSPDYGYQEYQGY